jgi:predicted DNA binding protein
MRLGNLGRNIWIHGSLDGSAKRRGRETGVYVDMLCLCLKDQSSEAETKEYGIIHKPETISNNSTEHRALLTFPLIIRYRL